MQRLPQFGVLTHAVAVAADRHQMTVMDETIDERGRHDLVTEDGDERRHIQAPALLMSPSTAFAASAVTSNR